MEKTVMLMRSVRVLARASHLVPVKPHVNVLRYWIYMDKISADAYTEVMQEHTFDSNDCNRKQDD